MVTSNSQALWINTPSNATYPTTEQFINLNFVAKVSIDGTVTTRVQFRYPVGAGIGQVNKVEFATAEEANIFMFRVRAALMTGTHFVDVNTADYTPPI